MVVVIAGVVVGINQLQVAGEFVHHVVEVAGMFTGHNPLAAFFNQKLASMSSASFALIGKGILFLGESSPFFERPIVQKVRHGRMA